jgi:hypothetical protein
MDSETKDTFFSDPTDYYYRYRISSIIEAKEEYNTIFDVIIKHEATIFSNLDTNDKDAILRKISTLRRDYNMYSNLLIKQNCINSNEKFSRVIENLMLVLNGTILYYEQNIVLNEKVNLKQKFMYDGKERNLRFIISRLKNTPYDLNLDEPINIIINKSQIFLSVICWIAITTLVFLIMFLVTYYPLEYINKVYGFLHLGNETTNTLNFILSILVGGWFFYKISSSVDYKITQVKSEVYRRNKSIVYKPFKTDKKAFKYGVAAVKYLLGFIHSSE